MIVQYIPRQGHTLTVINGIIINQAKYGLLYNWYAATDVRNIAASGWHVPSQPEMETLRIYLDTLLDPSPDINNNSGQKMKELAPSIHWNGGGGGTNTSGFNARGGGLRLSTGVFQDLTLSFDMWSSTVYVPGFTATRGHIVSNNIYFQTINGGVNFKVGMSIRLIKGSTTLSHGQTGTYTGNDGRVYQTICIGTQEWLSENLMETKYRNGDIIPEVTSSTAWAALSTGALCAYNNDWTNV